MSEIDFVVVYDDTVLVIEVKGGRLGRRDGLWTFTDRYGSSTQKREGPFDQARSAMFALQRQLRASVPWVDVAFGYLVLTPDQDLGRDLEWEPQLHAGPAAMSVGGLTFTLDSSRRYWLGKESRPPRGEAHKDLLAVLRPDFDRVPTLGSRISSLENDFVRLADRQYELLLGAERNQRIVCLGGAGSGKTLLAVETARRAAAEGASVLLTCRSPALAAVLTQTLTGTTVRCHPFDRTEGLEPVDVLVVDEGQDLMDVAASLQLDTLVRGGWDRGRWRIFCDPNNQANVDGEFDRSIFDELLAAASVVELPYNCRNTATIVQQTQLVTGADLGVARAGQGPAVQYEQSPDDPTTARLLDAHLKRLRQNGVEPRDITVVTLRAAVGDSSATLTKAFNTRRLRPADAGDPPPADAARLLTATQIKGLEAAHICVIDVQDTRDPVQRARLYVAMTRARISLWIALDPVAWTQIAEGPETGVPA